MQNVCENAVILFNTFIPIVLLDVYLTHDRINRKKRFENKRTQSFLQKYHLPENTQYKNTIDHSRYPINHTRTST